MQHLVRVKVTPGAKRELVTRTSEHRYEIFVQEPPERGLATARVRVLVAREYSVALSSVRLSTGAQSRSKTFIVTIV